MWIIKRGTQIQACIDAPYEETTATIVIKHWVASQGMSEKAIIGYEADFCPITKWDTLKKVFDPIVSGYHQL